MRSLSSLLSVPLLLLFGMLFVSLPAGSCTNDTVVNSSQQADAVESDKGMGEQYEFEIGNIQDVQVDPGRSSLINVPNYGGPFAEGHTSLSVATHVRPGSGIYGFMPMFMIMKFLYEGNCNNPIFSDPGDRSLALRIDITPEREHPDLTKPADYLVVLESTGQLQDDLVWFEGDNVAPHFGQTCRDVPTGIAAVRVREEGKHPALRIRPELEQSGFTITMSFTMIHSGPLTTFVSMLSLEDPLAKPGHGPLLSWRYSAYANYTYNHDGQTLQSSVELAEGIPAQTFGLYCTNSPHCAEGFANSFVVN